MRQAITRGAAAFVIAGGACAPPAVAQVSAAWQRVPITPAAVAHDPQLVDMQCWDLRVTTTGNWDVGGLRAVLPPGNFFYKSALGSSTRPNPALFTFAPSLEFTTYLTAPGDVGTASAPSILGGFPEDPFSLGHASAPIPGTVSAVWGDLNIDPPGTYQIVRLTFPNGVFPNVINIPDVGPAGMFSNMLQSMPNAIVEVP